MQPKDVREGNAHDGQLIVAKLSGRHRLRQLLGAVREREFLPLSTEARAEVVAHGVVVVGIDDGGGISAGRVRGGRDEPKREAIEPVGDVGP